jgi:adenosylmethionine-8-amino-7-oxononanoate aminotransferase
MHPRIRRFNDQLDQWDHDHFFHPSTHLAQFARGELKNRIVTGGEGVYISDRDGNRLLDAFAGLYCVNVGYGRRRSPRQLPRRRRNWPITTPMSATAPRPRSRLPRWSSTARPRT